MPLIVKNTAPPRELTPAGTYQAICIGHYHIGTQHSDKFNKDDDQIILSFALNEKRPDGKHFIVSTKGLTTSFGEKANLTKLLKGWLGQIPAMNEGFDTSSLVDRQCLITIIHEKGQDGNVYDRIQSVIAPPRGSTEFRYDGNTFDYSPIDPSKPIPEEVPRFIQEKIQASKEWREHHDGTNGTAKAGTNGRDSGTFVNPAPAERPAPPPIPPEIKGYMKYLKLSWPFDTEELERALSRMTADSTPEEIAEAKAALEPHVDSIPF